MDDALAFLESTLRNRPRCHQQRLSGPRVSYEPAANTGINIGVAAPMAILPFKRMAKQLLRRPPRQAHAHRVLHDKKVVVERWAKEHTKISSHQEAHRHGEIQRLG